MKFFVLPNLPRDVWHGEANKPEKAKLCFFVSDESPLTAEQVCAILNTSKQTPPVAS